MRPLKTLKTLSMAALMVGLVMTGVVMTGVVRADEVKKPTLDEELKGMQGRWKVVSAEVGGKAADLKAMGIETVRVAGTTLTAFNNDKEIMSVQMELDVDQTPRQMTWVDPKRGRYPLIYELAGDRLTLCFPLSQAKLDAPLERPTKFDNPGKPIAVLKLERLPAAGGAAQRPEKEPAAGGEGGNGAE